MAALFTPLSPEAARLATLFARHAAGLGFTAGGASWTFAPGGRNAGDHGLAVYGSIGEAEFTCWLDEPHWRVAAAAVLDVRPEDVPALPPTLVQAALECFFSDALTALEAGLGLPVAVSRLVPGKTPSLASSHRFRLVREDGLLVSGAWTAVPGEWRQAVETALGRVRPREQGLPDGFTLDGVVSVALWRMTARELATLAVGDVALSPMAAQWTMTVGRRFRFAARSEKGKLVVDGASAADAAMEPGDASVVNTDASVLSDIGEAEVEMRAEVGRVGISLTDLQRLSVGEVVEFATGIETPAALVAGGVVVARGELVDVGGRVGVRITSLGSAREKEKNA